jgi:hypothetical protein
MTRRMSTLVSTRPKRLFRSRSRKRSRPSHPPRRKFLNGSSGSYGSIHIGMCRSRQSVYDFILNLFTRKLFTFVITLNIIGITLAASGHFAYADKYTSAMALGNLNVAILMRNELFGRFLYLFVNAFFAKVPSLYFSTYVVLGVYCLSVDTVMVETRLHICSSGMNSFYLDPCEKPHDDVCSI